MEGDPFLRPDMTALDAEMNARYGERFDRRPPLVDVGVDPLDIQPSHEILSSHPYLNADVIPGLRDTREEARERAESILAARRETLNDGKFEDVVMDIDALGTASKVLEVERLFGKGSPEAREAFLGLVEDCDRIYGEARSGNVKEYFKPRRQDYVAHVDGFHSRGHWVDDLLDGGLSPLAHVEEQGNRVGESMEGATHKAVMKEAYADDVCVLTLSQCAQFAIDEYKVRPKNGEFAGYVPRVKKLVGRAAWFSKEDQCMYSSQMWVSGELIDEDVINLWLQQNGVTAEGTELSKVEVRRTQIIGKNEGEHSIINLQRSLDEVASEHHGFPIFCGERLKEGEVADYERIIPDAEEREKAREGEGKLLAEYVMQMARDGENPWAARIKVARRVKADMLDVAKSNPSLAAAIFDEETAERCRVAEQHYLNGNYALAQQEWEMINQTAPDPSYCGGVACGLEDIDSKSPEGQKVRQMLEAEEGDVAVRDIKRPCPGCGEMTAVYVYKKLEKAGEKGKVNKGCLNPECGLKEFSGKLIKPSKPKETTSKQFAVAA